MGRQTFICGPPDARCWVYGTLVADEHLYEGRGSRSPHEHGQGPLCLRCGVPKGTTDWEAADVIHHATTGHHLGTGHCEDACGELSPRDLARASIPT